MSEHYMRDGTDLASPGAGQRRGAWLKEPPETAERRCTPHLIRIIRRERLGNDHDVPWSMVAFLQSTLSPPAVASDMEKSPSRLAIRSLCA